MAKDPAFLFYPGDWLSGTMFMTFEEKGAYMELLMMQFNHGPFDMHMAKVVLKGQIEQLWPTMIGKFKSDDGILFYNERLKAEKEKRQNYTESRRAARKKSDEDSVRMYIVRDNVRENYKIGSSVNPLRRYNELSFQASPAIMQGERDERDLTLIWYSCIVERTEEGKLHELFANKRIVGEWFDLTQKDLNYIFKTYEGTYVERTIERTENENENENKDVIKKTKKDKPVKEPKIEYAPDVKLTESENQKLLDEHGFDLTNRAYTYLANYKIEKAYKTKSDYHTIIRWVIDAVKNKINGQSGTGNKPNPLASFNHFAEKATEAHRIISEGQGDGGDLFTQIYGQPSR